MIVPHLAALVAAAAFSETLTSLLSAFLHCLLKEEEEDGIPLPPTPSPSGNGSADSESELEMKAKQRRGGDGRHLRRAAQQVLDR